MTVVVYNFSFFLIKPDAVRRRSLGKILAVIEAEGSRSPR